MRIFTYIIIKNIRLFIINHKFDKIFKRLAGIPIIKEKNLWCGQIISRPYEGKGLTLVLFDLKPGFKFEDKGHANEQITWLISGKMDFHANGKNKTLTSDIGVDIGPNHIHGGVSGGALGYDAFYPKRDLGQSL